MAATMPPRLADAWLSSFFPFRLNSMGESWGERIGFKKLCYAERSLRCFGDRWLRGTCLQNINNEDAEQSVWSRLTADHSNAFAADESAIGQAVFLEHRGQRRP